MVESHRAVKNLERALLHVLIDYRLRGVPIEQVADYMRQRFTASVVEISLFWLDLVKHYPEPRIEIHPRLAAKLGIADGAWTTCETRRGAITLRAQVVTTIRPDTVFIPYHWPGKQAANQLTIRAVDPLSKMPEFKVAAVQVARAGEPAA